MRMLVHTSAVCNTVASTLTVHACIHLFSRGRAARNEGLGLAWTAWHALGITNGSMAAVQIGQLMSE